VNEPSWAYFDTSTLVKRYVTERGSLLARQLLQKHRFLSSAIAPVELLSAVSRRRDQKELSASDYTAILSRIRQDRSFWELVEITPALLAKAEEMILNSKTRTLDAIHVASAVTFQDLSGMAIPFATSDKQQFAAARKCGLEVVLVG
jgi:predicted nucleic acid-binding protein